MGSGKTNRSTQFHRRHAWRASWLGVALIAAAGLMGCGPITRIYLEQPRQIGGVPPEDVPYLRLSASLEESAAELERRGFAYSAPSIRGQDQPELKYYFANAAPGVYESATIHVYFRQAWHRGMFYLLCKDDEVLLVSWRLSNMSP